MAVFYYRRIIRLDELGAPDLLSVARDNRRIKRHNFLHLVVRDFQRTKFSEGNLSFVRFYTGKSDRRTKHLNSVGLVRLDVQFVCSINDFVFRLSLDAIPFLFGRLLFDCIVQHICAIYQYNCAKNGKGLRIGTKELIPYRSNIGGILKY